LNLVMSAVDEAAGGGDARTGASRAPSQPGIVAHRHHDAERRPSRHRDVDVAEDDDHGHRQHEESACPEKVIGVLKKVSRLQVVRREVLLRRDGEKMSTSSHSHRRKKRGAPGSGFGDGPVCGCMLDRRFLESNAGCCA